MDRMPLPTPWNVYNLTASPFFQGYLSADATASAPLNLFVGRAKEVSQLRDRIHGTGAHGTRQAVSGAPGVGKTTLVQEVKARLQEDGYFTSSSFVSVQPDETPAQLFGSVLGVVYDTMIANRPGLTANEHMREAQLLVRATRLASRSGGVSVAGFGVQGGSNAVPVTPNDIMYDGPRILRDLMRLVASSDARGLILHVNNLENLSDKEAKAAAEVFRALRDLMLMHDRLHFLLEGTSDAVRIVVDTHQQVRSIVTNVPLEPLSESEAKALLEARYRHLMRDPARDFVQPATDEVVEKLHRLYMGDLRSLLRALEDGVTPLLGIGGAGGGDPEPIGWEEIAPVLHDHYAAVMTARLEPARAAQLEAWGRSGVQGAMTQEDLEKLWGLSRGAVSTAVNHLVDQGYVVAHPRKRREPIQYTLSETSALIFGLDV